jgi:phosphoglycolate phosphatase
MNIIFDLDGTLIDSRLRLYRLFQHLAPDSPLSYEKYWAFKERKISNETILSSELGHNQDQIARFVRHWMTLIESPAYLALDKNFPGIHSALARLQQQADLHVCTARQLRQPVLDQLANLGLLKFFKQVLVTEQIERKETLIASHVAGLSSQDWLVGDTGKDIQVGKLLNIKTCAVLSGFLNRESLQTYEPDLIIDSVGKMSATTDLFGWLNNCN